MSAADSLRTDPPFERLATDPRIVRDLHRICDGWCERCPFTERCLAFRCLSELRRARARGTRRVTAASEALAFHRQMFLVDPGPRPPAVDHDARGERVDFEADEVLAATARDYATRSACFVTDAVPTCSMATISTASPPPKSAVASAKEVVLRFHSTIHFKTTRALVGRALTAGGKVAWAVDAASCAAQVLSCGDRSRDALARYEQSNERDVVMRLLAEILRHVAWRFPAAVAWRDDCLRRATTGQKTTPSGRKAKFDIAHAELVRRR